MGRNNPVKRKQKFQNDATNKQAKKGDQKEASFDIKNGQRVINSDVNGVRSSSPRRPTQSLPQQKEGREVRLNKSSLKVHSQCINQSNTELLEDLNSNENSCIGSSKLNWTKVQKPSKEMIDFNETQLQARASVRRKLAEELDVIDAEFEQNAAQTEDQTELLAPDGIRITVNRDEEDEFQEEDDEPLDYEDETIYPLPQDDDDDAETVAGEEVLNTSLDSSAIISFKKQKNDKSGSPVVTNDKLNQRMYAYTSAAGKTVANMTPEELMKENPELRQLMAKLSKQANVGDKRLIKDKDLIEGKNRQAKDLSKSSPVVKLPSDTTIYAPALKLSLNEQPAGVVQRFLVDNQKPDQEWSGVEVANTRGHIHVGDTGGGGDDTLNHISDFVERIRAESVLNKGCEQVVREPQPGTSREPEMPSVQLDEADRAAWNMVIQAECFKASTEIPRGMVYSNVVMGVGNEGRVANAGQVDRVPNIVTSPEVQHNYPHLT